VIKNIVVVLVVMVMLAGVGAGVYLMQQSTEFREKAAPATTMSFSTQTSSPEIGQVFNVHSVINTAENQVAGVQLNISFTPGMLELVEVTPADSFFEELGQLTPKIDNELGTLELVMWTMPNTSPSQGTATVATLSFKALKAGTATVSYDDSSLVGAIQEDDKNVLVGTTPLTLNILGPSATPTATLVPGEPSATVSPTAAASPSATVAPSATATVAEASPTDVDDGGVGGNTETSTPTQTLTPTPTNSDDGDSGNGSTSTNTPTNSPTDGGSSNLTSVQELPDSGIAEVALTSVGIGIFILFIGLILAL
jgi:hypothetical protein